MLNDIIKGVSMALNAAFGNDYKIYQNDVSQGLEEPCFLILILKPEMDPLLDLRYRMLNPLDIHYFPRDPRDNADMIRTAETMYDVLEVITLPNGEPIRGIDMSYEIVDDVLHFFVSYNHIMVRDREHYRMETLDIDARPTSNAND